MAEPRPRNGDRQALTSLRRIKTKQSKTKLCSGKRSTVRNQHTFLTGMKEALQADTSPINKVQTKPQANSVTMIISVTIIITVTCILIVLCTINKNHCRHLERTGCTQADSQVIGGSSPIFGGQVKPQLEHWVRDPNMKQKS